MKFVKRNISFVIAAPAIAVILTCYLFLGVSSDKATFQLKHIDGDTSALKGVTISGYLQDLYHHQFFQITNGSVSNRFNYYEDSRDVISPRVYYANGLADEDKVYWYSIDYKIPDGTDRVDVVVTLHVRNEDFHKNIPNDYALFNTSIYLEGIPQKGNDGIGERIINSGANVLTVIEGKPFFTIPLSGKYFGKCGIYEVEKFGVWYDAQRPGRVRTVAEFDLNGRNVEVLGLESLGDKLLLLLDIDDVLTVRAFDLAGRMIDEISVPEAGGSLGRYESFKDRSMIHLSFGMNDATFSMDGPILSLSFEDGKLTLKHLITALGLDNATARHHLIDTVDDRLYIITSTTEKDKMGEYEYSNLAPQHLKILVYKSSNRTSSLLYEGELVTDADEDYEKLRHGFEPKPNHYANREFVDAGMKVEQEADFR